MRHRATRPFTGLLLGLPRATAQWLGLTAGGPARTRVLGLLVVVLALGGVGYGVVASVVGGGDGPQAEPSVTAEPPATAEPDGAGRREPGTTVSASQDPTPTATPEEPVAPTPVAQPEDPSSTGGASPSAAEASDRLPSIAVRSATPSPRPVPSTTAGDDVPPDTTVSHEVTGPGAALLTFSADEPATFACSLDGAAYAPCAVRGDLHRPLPGVAHLRGPRDRRRGERRRQPGRHPVALRQRPVRGACGRLTRV